MDSNDNSNVCIKDTQSNKYQLTINNPVDKGYTHEYIKTTLLNNFKTLTYFCLADEEGSCYHTHVFVIFTSRVRFSMIKKHFPDAHIEKCKGSTSDNVNYVKKTGKWDTDESKQEKKIEGTFEEYGIQPPDSKGRRNDLSELFLMIQSGMSNCDILTENQDYIMQIDKLDKIRYTILSETYNKIFRKDLTVTYISGVTGTGKTRGVFEKHGYENVYRVTDYEHPFDGYKGQPVICFDEFRSSLRMTEMLDYLDKHPCELPSRYSNKVACYEKVYIISNWRLEQQYSELQISDQESWAAFKRRINNIIVYNADGSCTKYNSVQDYDLKRIYLDDTDNEPLPFK